MDSARQAEVSHFSPPSRERKLKPRRNPLDQSTVFLTRYVQPLETLMKISRMIPVAALMAVSSVSWAGDIVDTAVSAGQFKTLVTALKEANLVDTLKQRGPYTVFAPTDAAFAKLPAGTLDALLKDREKLTAVLTYHVVPGKIMAAQVKPGEVATAQGQALTISTQGSTVMVDEAKVIKTDIAASNGVIHVIDSVILPD